MSYEVFDKFDNEDQDIEIKKVMSIKLNFYQLWCMFGTLPQRKCNGYIFNIRDDFGNNFMIYTDPVETDMMSANTNTNMTRTNTKNRRKRVLKKLKKQNKWNIGVKYVNNESVKHFMEHLFEALVCYDRYYKCIEDDKCIESSTYSFTDREHFGGGEYEKALVSKRIESIKQELVNNNDLFCSY